MTAEKKILDYQNLSPDEILNAVEGEGYQCDGRLLALNSYENRVYQIGIEEDKPIIVKFYRPERWNDSAIMEEHEFAWELAESEIPVVAPIKNEKGDSLRRHKLYRFALFPNQGGRAPNLENSSHLEKLGRYLGRIHSVGKSKIFRYRPTLTAESFGQKSCEFLLKNKFIPKDIETAYQSLTDDLIQRIAWCYERAGDSSTLRLHGDCHPGNILWTDDGPHFVDLDDSRNGPAIQDLWMLLSGERIDQIKSLNALLNGYTEFFEFDPRQLHLIEALRTLRMLHYYAWIAKRWTDPAFPRAYPWFNTQRCWEEHILHLREQVSLMDEEPLSLR
jgi:Ser/Thr protein kinase RdoA (MazF antagonist)